MKFIKYLYFILLPILIVAQSRNTDKASSLRVEEEYDWSVSDEQGLVLSISGDSINYKESWLHIPGTGCAILSKTKEPIGLETLKPPFRAIVSYYGKGSHRYIKSLQFLQQFAYDDGGMIINSE